MARPAADSEARGSVCCAIFTTQGEEDAVPRLGLPLPEVFSQWLGLWQPPRHVAQFVAPSLLPKERKLPRRASACLCLKCFLGFTFPFHSPPNQPKEVSLQKISKKQIYLFHSLEFSSSGRCCISVTASGSEIQSSEIILIFGSTTSTIWRTRVSVAEFRIPIKRIESAFRFIRPLERLSSILCVLSGPVEIATTAAIVEIASERIVVPIKIIGSLEILPIIGKIVIAVIIIVPTGLVIAELRTFVRFRISESTVVVFVFQILGEFFGREIRRERTAEFAASVVGRRRLLFSVVVVHVRPIIVIVTEFGISISVISSSTEPIVGTTKPIVGPTEPIVGPTESIVGPTETVVGRVISIQRLRVSFVERRESRIILELIKRIGRVTLKRRILILMALVLGRVIGLRRNRKVKRFVVRRMQRLRNVLAVGK